MSAMLFSLYEEIPNQSNSKKEGFPLVHSLRGPSVMMVRTQQQEQVLAGHLVSVVRQQKKWTLVLISGSPLATFI